MTHVNMTHVKMSRIALVVLLVALFAAVSTTFAQDTSMGLSEADAALLAAAAENSGSASSFSFDVSGRLNMINSPDTGNFLVSFSGGGSIETADQVLQLNLNGDADIDGERGNWQVELRVIGEMFYANLGPMMGGWIGGSADSLTALGGSLLPVDPAALTNPEAMGALMGQPDMTDALMGLATLNPADFVNQTRTDRDGFAVFTTEIDFSNLMRTEAMQQFIAGISQTAQEGGDEFEESMDIAAEALGMTTLTLTQIVDPNSQLIEAATIELRMELDPAAMGEEGDRLLIELVVEVDLKDYNQPVIVTAPSTFQDIGEMLGMMSGMGMGMEVPGVDMSGMGVTVPNMGTGN